MLDRTIRLIDALLTGIGKATAFLVLLVTALIIGEIVARSVFRMPSPWAHELSTWLMAAFIFLGGPYALIRGRFVRVDILHAQFSPKLKAIIDTVVTTALFACFLGVLFWIGGEIFLKAYAIDERSGTGGWRGPVWLAKALVPLGAALLCLGWLSHLLRLWRGILRGES